MRNGVDINLCKNDGSSFFYIVCCNGYNSIVRYLFVNGVYIDLCNDNGISFFWIVCEYGYDNIV